MNQTECIVFAYDLNLTRACLRVCCFNIVRELIAAIERATKTYNKKVQTSNKAVTDQVLVAGENECHCLMDSDTEGLFL